MTRATLDKRPHEMAAMFDAVAKRYDLTNDILSLGQVRRWRRQVLQMVSPRPGDRVLDLAAGTGTSSEPFEAAEAIVVPCDFSLGMLRQGKRARPAMRFTAGDGTRLPFAITVRTPSLDRIGLSTHGLRLQRPGGVQEHL